MRDMSGLPKRFAVRPPATLSRLSGPQNSPFGFRCYLRVRGVVRACVAVGTFPRVDELICVPVSVPVLTFAAVMASFLTFAVVTAFFFSCLEPTEFLPSVNATALPPSASTMAMTARTWADEMRTFKEMIEPGKSIDARGGAAETTRDGRVRQGASTRLSRWLEILDQGERTFGSSPDHVLIPAT